MFRPLLAGLLLLALAGCATPEKRPFQSPRSGPTAEVSFRNATPGRTEVAIFEDAAECTGRRFLPDLLIGEQQTVRVPAGKPLAFGIRYIVPNTTPQRYCEVLASFEVEPNGRYEVIIRSGSDRPCTPMSASSSAPPPICAPCCAHRSKAATKTVPSAFRSNEPLSSTPTQRIQVHHAGRLQAPAG